MDEDEKKVNRFSRSSLNKIKNHLNEEFFRKLSPLMRLNLLAILIGIIGGVGSWLFRMAIDFAYWVFYLLPMSILASSIFSQFMWLPFLVSPVLGGLIVGVLTTRFSRETKGAGIPEVLESIAIYDGRMRMRVPFVKIVASATTIGSGGSAGREGPIVQIGAGFASSIGQFLGLKPKEMRTLVVSGVCAGISSTFNAPIGGLLFGLEIIRRESSVILFMPLIVASVVGTVVGQLLLGFNPTFEGFPPLVYNEPSFIPLFIVLGIVLGIASALWIKTFYYSEDLLEASFKKLKIPEYLNPVIGGLFVGIILLLTFLLVGDQWEIYTIMGGTYRPMDAVFNGFLTTGPVTTILMVLVILLFVKVLGTYITLGSGGSGGELAPTLFLGVMIGGIFGVIFRDILNISTVDVVVFALLGMAGFFGGSGRAPLTAIILTAEMTNDYFLAIPLMFVVTLSWLISVLLEKDDIYIKKLTRRGTKINDLSLDILELVSASKVMKPVSDLTTIHTEMDLKKLLTIIRRTKKRGFPVFDGNKFVGVITLNDVEETLENHPEGCSVGLALKEKQQTLICIEPDANLAEVIEAMVKHHISRIPVVKSCSAETLDLVGWITYHDIIQAYQATKLNYRQIIDQYK